jgi:PIN domain nuclease of toxin-antitoxin system
MRLLLDTHIWLWSLAEPERLGPRVRSELRNPGNELWLSSVSVWEALLLAENGRIKLPEERARWVEAATAHFWEAPLTHTIALAAHELRLEHRDPADRFLAATAQTLQLTLVTADERLLGLGEIKTIANR